MRYWPLHFSFFLLFKEVIVLWGDCLYGDYRSTAATAILKKVLVDGRSKGLNLVLRSRQFATCLFAAMLGNQLDPFNLVIDLANPTRLRVGTRLSSPFTRRGSVRRGTTVVVQLQVANRGGAHPREQLLGLFLVRSEVFTRQVRLDEGRHADLSRAARTH